MENDLLVYGDPLFDNFDELLDLSKEETQILQASEEAPPLPPPPPLPLSSWQQQQQQQQQNDGSTADLQLPPVITSDVLSGSARDTTDAFFCDDLDIAEMEWLSNFVEESFSPPTSIAGLDGSKATFAMSGSDLVVSKGTVDADVDVDLDVANYGNNQQVVPVAATGDGEELLYLTHDSPLSVLENNGNGILLGSNSSGISSTSSSTYYYSSSSPTSSASCSGTISEFKEVAGCPPGATERGRAPRTKRSRPIAFPHSTDVPPSSSDANTADGTTLAASNNPDADHNHNVNKKKKKKLKIKLTPPTAANYTGTINGTSTTGGGGGGGGGGGEVRKCLHCGIQKTPQWRAGPMGPKTLCNACGVRYKSGRLFPEYRPAASPTFVASVHSNSHKKVVEMRMKYSSKQEEDSGRPIKQVSSKCCELLNYLRGDIDKQWGAHEGRKDGPDVVVACLPEINSFKFQSGGN